MFNLNDLQKITSILSPSGLLENFKKLLVPYEEKVGELKKENQELKDRLRKLIGEQEVPKFKPKKDKKDLHHQRPSKKDRKKNWKKNGKKDEIKKIEGDFDLIFKKEYHSFMINHCRANTLSRREGLLSFLDHPLIPIHNNQAESYIREKVIRRKISGGHKNDRGAAAGNMWISLYQTVRKNGLSFFSLSSGSI